MNATPGYRHRLLVLLLVGLASKEFVTRHRRLREFSIADFELLIRFLRGYSPIIVTPNVWTETSNLARQISGPAKEKVSHVMREMMNKTQEDYINSKSASARNEFLRLGLTDSALLELKPTTVPILTSDLDLYLTAQALRRPVFNFNHMREANQE